jgi:hypothetical protein
MEEKLLTTREAELIEAIRDLKKSKHNPSFILEVYARDLFDELLKEDYNDSHTLRVGGR